MGRAGGLGSSIAPEREKERERPTNLQGDKGSEAGKSLAGGWGADPAEKGS